jgi:hypothetical protein
VDRADERLADRAGHVVGLVVLGDAPRDGGPDLGRRAPVGGDDQELLWFDAATQDAVGRDLGEQSGLTGAGSAEDPDEPLRAVEHPLGGRLPPERCVRCHRPAHEPKSVRGDHRTMEPRRTRFGNTGTPAYFRAWFRRSCTSGCES